MDTQQHLETNQYRTMSPVEVGQSAPSPENLLYSTPEMPAVERQVAVAPELANQAEVQELARHYQESVTPQQQQILGEVVKKQSPLVKQLASAGFEVSDLVDSVEVASRAQALSQLSPTKGGSWQGTLLEKFLQGLD